MHVRRRAFIPPDRLPRGHVPQRDPCSRRGRGPLAVWRIRHAADRRDVIEPAEFLAGLDVPNAHGVVAQTRQQAPAVGRKRHAIARDPGLAEAADLFAAGEVPHRDPIPFPTGRRALRPSGEIAMHVGRIPPCRSGGLPCPKRGPAPTPPYRRRRRRHRSAVGGHGHHIEVRPAPEPPAALAALRVPLDDRAIGPALLDRPPACEELPVARQEGHRPDLVPVPLEPPHLAERTPTGGGIARQERGVPARRPRSRLGCPDGLRLLGLPAPGGQPPRHEDRRPRS